MELEKTYEPQRFEPHWADWWVENSVFQADANAPGPTFSIVVPPPNVTGSMHIGHMLEHSLIDTAVRWHRMRGDNTLFLPGVDHAGIATQMLVERSLAADGISRHQLGREEFVRRVWEWKEKYGSRITGQMKRIGDSCDWSRERFTLSPELSRAVTEAFVRLYERGLIYRGTYMVNWCPRCNTALSDLEVKHDDVNGHLWHIRYPVKDSPRSLVVATTRPETMLGDTAVAVNPKDARYQDLAGKSVILPLMNREIPIIFDELAVPEFGTGVVKVTPAHDPNDLEAGKRHNLPHIRVIGEDARMTADAGPYAGLDRFEARKRVVADLEKSGAARKDRSITCYPSASAIAAEPSWNRSSPRSGSSKPSPWRRRPWRRCAMAASDSSRTIGKRRSSIGWKTFATGASRANFGGVIGFLRGTARIAKKSPWRAKRPRPARIADRRAWSRIPMFSIPGSAPASGHFLLWAGRTIQKICGLTIRRRS